MIGNPQDNFVPKVIGGFNIPKAVIECKVDTLTFLEILVRKGIITPEELDEIRMAVVLHLNVLYPELQLSYVTPPPLGEQAPLPNINDSSQLKPENTIQPPVNPQPNIPKQPQQPAQKPLFYSAPPPKMIKSPNIKK